MLNIDKTYLDNSASLNGVAWMSFFWAVSSLMVFSILPAYLVDELKITHLKIGYIEGIAISSSFLSKFFAGYLSDYLKNRKSLIMAGTVVNAITKPLFALSITPGLIFFTRLADRLGKGVRSAPTDALIADLSNEMQYAGNFGNRQSLYTLGHVVGAILAMTIMLLSNNNYKLVFALSFIPAFFAVLLLIFFVKPSPLTHPRANSSKKFNTFSFNEIKQFSHSFWLLLIAFFFLMLARFSEAFLTLKAKDIGFKAAYLPILIIAMDLIHAAIARPSGKYADKISKEFMLVIGLILMIMAQLIIGLTSSTFGFFSGIILVGLHMGITQGLLKALIAKSTPPEFRGTAFSLFFISSGVAIFLANTIAGSLSQTFSLKATFIAGALFTVISVIIIYFSFLSTKLAAMPSKNSPLLK